MKCFLDYESNELQKVSELEKDCKVFFTINSINSVKGTYQMSKQSILKLGNRMLEPFGAKIVKRGSDIFTMSDAIRRIGKTDVAVKSIFDIGASNGRWSMEAMDMYPRASFLAIDPLHERQDALARLKQKHENFDYISCVAGDVDGEEVDLNVSDDLDGSTVHGAGGEKRTVPVRTIDSLVIEKSLKGPFLLKFDTHGYEIPILDGAVKTLEQTNIIIMEAYNFKISDRAMKFHEMCFYLEEKGFRCFDIVDLMHRLYDETLWQMDLFFCRSDSERFLNTQYR